MGGLGLALAATVPAAWAATGSPDRQPRAATAGYARFYEQKPAWGACERASATVQCARVTVPVDWAAPQGQTIDLAVARSAGGTGGPLVLNPGGPGLSGVNFLIRGEQELRGDGLAAYDLISWDPRGSGRSAPLTCPDDATAAMEKADASPDTPAEARAFDEAAARWARACRAASGPVFDHMDAGSTARDLDVLRAVTGAPKLNYLGISYGTMIGGRYAELFPQRVGRMILDSAGHFDQTYGSFLSGVAQAKERALTDYLTGCADRPECPLTRMTTGEARGWIQRLLRGTDRDPLRSGDTTVSQAQFAAVLARDVSDRNGWERLDAELAELLAGEASIVAQTAPPTTMDIDNIATTCQDLPERRTAAQVLRDSRAVARTAPTFGREITAGSPCVHWPAPVPTPPHKLHAKGVPPILVVGITRDTAGPYRWSRELAAQLGNARLLTYDGSGHGAYLLDKCVRDAANGFLADGTLPAAGAVCRGA
ncbi:alpha/beta hydrolase [Actinoplanes sp. NBRC 14428]|nr:alpha/beta hydrolase [Actinoplanes sp. NBRC 14428]